MRWWGRIAHHQAQWHGHDAVREGVAVGAGVDHEAQEEASPDLVAEPFHVPGIARGDLPTRCHLDRDQRRADLDDGVDLSLSAGRAQMRQGPPAEVDLWAQLLEEEGLQVSTGQRGVASQLLARDPREGEAKGRVGQEAFWDSSSAF